MPHSSNAKVKRTFRRRQERRLGRFLPEESQQQTQCQVFAKYTKTSRTERTAGERALRCIGSWVFKLLIRIIIMAVIALIAIRIFFSKYIKPSRTEQTADLSDRNAQRDFLEMMLFIQCIQMQRDMQRQSLVAAIEAERHRQLLELFDDTTDIAGLVEESRCCRLMKEIDGVSLTTDDEQPDVITLDSSTEHTRAVMPCGHVIGPQSLYDYCFYCVLPGGKVDIVCPEVGCNATWNYATVRHVACLSSAETEDMETRLTLNYLRHKVGYQQCKGCDTWCCRADPDKISCSTVSCPVCTEREDRDYSFCWGCLEECNDDLVNGGCVCEDTTQDVQQQLRECPDKQLIQCGVMCPSVRACPQCFALLEHAENCQHVQCKSCFYWFCFICLHPSGCHGDNSESRDACRAPFACQQVAHRQVKQISTAD